MFGEGASGLRNWLRLLRIEGAVGVGVGLRMGAFMPIHLLFRV